MLAAGRFIRDFLGNSLRLTDERLDHILTQHPEIARLGLVAIEDALRHPDAVKSVEAFVVTAYVTARQKKGVRVWPETT